MNDYKELLTNAFLMIYKDYHDQTKNEDQSKIALIDLINDVLSEMKMHNKLYVKYDELRNRYDKASTIEERKELEDKLQILVKARKILEE